MKRRWTSLTLVIAMAGCDAPRQAANDSGSAESANETTLPAPVGPPAPDSTAPGQPGGLPDDRTPISEGAIDPNSPQGAGQVLQSYGALLEQRKFAAARRLWGDNGRASGLTEIEFIETYSKYSEIHAEVGRPGDAEGAAGSIYTEVPVRLYGKLKSGGPVNLVGTMTLRRVNDVPGSTAEQRRWHIASSDLKPRPS